MSFIHALKVAGSALMAQRQRLNAITSNLANAETTRAPDGGPYRRLDPIFRARPEGFGGELGAVESVEVAAVQQDRSPPRMVYDPDHPDADERGYVAMPNVNVVQEMVDMISASRSYEAATSAVRTAKDMFNAALEIGS